MFFSLVIRMMESIIKLLRVFVLILLASSLDWWNIRFLYLIFWKHIRQPFSVLNMLRFRHFFSIPFQSKIRKVIIFQCGISVKNIADNIKINKNHLRYDAQIFISEFIAVSLMRFSLGATKVFFYYFTVSQQWFVRNILDASQTHSPNVCTDWTMGMHFMLTCITFA